MKSYPNIAFNTVVLNLLMFNSCSKCVSMYRGNVNLLGLELNTHTSYPYKTFKLGLANIRHFVKVIFYKALHKSVALCSSPSVFSFNNFPLISSNVNKTGLCYVVRISKERVFSLKFHKK